ncbi:AmmeMemoRadiSam system protein A [Litoribacillus peritrichatus]|uniref:AMMECR1 domain-containing protein n=1 Tax=Litoribacillus peritrichatus TaxID=718191 RepID=A0ABP7MTF8_9GAMM
MQYTNETPVTQLNEGQKSYLLAQARTAIEHGASTGHLPGINFEKTDQSLLADGCSFVTLHKNGQLRGCIGALTPYQPLVKDVMAHAFAAAFKDPRFDPVSQEEVPKLQIQISVLTPQEPIFFKSEAELLDQLTPLQDGLTLEAGLSHATFLPAVWENLPDKTNFLEQLKLKAGLSADYWSDTINAFRYQTICFSEPTH